MKKILILSILLFPAITFGAWWNPSSWSEQKASVIEAVEPTQVQPQIIERVVEVPVEKEVVKEVIKEVPKVVEKVVEKVITVPDQNVLKQNMELSIKVYELENKVKLLESQYGFCKINLPKAEPTPEKPKLSSTCEDIHDRIDSKKEEIEGIREDGSKRVERVTDATATRISDDGLSQSERKARIETARIEAINKVSVEVNTAIREIKSLKNQFSAMCGIELDLDSYKEIPLVTPSPKGTNGVNA